MPDLTRDELVRLHALHKAAADALEARIKNEALDEHERHHMGVSWRLPGAGVTTNLAHNTGVVSDEEAFLDYLEEHTAAVVRREVREVPGEFRKRWLLEEVYPVIADLQAGTLVEPTRKQLTPGARFPVAAKATGKLVPGVWYVHGGSLVSISLKLDDGLKTAARKAAARYADGEIGAQELFDTL